jgi:hypothetical protein
MLPLIQQLVAAAGTDRKTTHHNEDSVLAITTTLAGNR